MRPSSCFSPAARQRSLETRRALARAAVAMAEAAALEEAARIGWELRDLKAKGEGRRLLKSADVRAARVRVWRAMRDRGLPFTAIAEATGAGAHTTVITALRREGRGDAGGGGAGA